MANPRQRRKARSGSHSVRVSKHANSRLKKVTPQNFPAGLADAYNVRQTPIQNYRRLGLLSGKLAPRLAGGIEKDTNLKNSWLNRAKTVDEFDLLATADDDDDTVEGDLVSEENELEVDKATVHQPTDGKLSKGEGRIIRDKDGRIVKIIIGDEREIEVDPTAEASSTIVIKRPTTVLTESTPWGKPYEPPKFEKEPSDHEPTASSSGANVLQGIEYQNPRKGVVPPKTTFVEELEKISQQRSNQYTAHVKQKQHLSVNQVNWLMRLVDKHGLENVEQMARDLKLNTHQKTVGEIRHMIRKLVK